MHSSGALRCEVAGARLDVIARSPCDEAIQLFAAIPASWRCPDCGTEKSTFRPYVEASRSQTAI